MNPLHHQKYLFALANVPPLLLSLETAHMFSQGILVSSFAQACKQLLHTCAQLTQFLASPKGIALVIPDSHVLRYLTRYADTREC